MFSEADRQIFEYQGWDRKTKKFADPAKVLRRLKERFRGSFGSLMSKTSDPDPAVSSAAISEIADAAVYAFEIQPKDAFDPESGGGWLEAHLVMLVDDFNVYINGLKKNTEA